MTAEPPAYLTTRELAELLRVKERKVYELASSGAVPCSRATGKLLFPRAEIDAWLKRHRMGAEEPTQALRPNVIAGSHDPLLEWALRESRSGLAMFLDGSLDGLERLRRGDAIAAGIHLTEPDNDGWNRTHLRAMLPDEPLVLIHWAWRDQGLILPPGNPHNIAGLADLKGRRFIPRQSEAGTFVLLKRLAAEAGLSMSDFELLTPPARTQTDVAAAIADGKADAGLGLACMARQFRLDFLHLARERFDIAIYRRAYFEPPFQRLIQFANSTALINRANELSGYDVSMLGQVQYNAAVD